MQDCYVTFPCAALVQLPDLHVSLFIACRLASLPVHFDSLKAADDC